MLRALLWFLRATITPRKRQRRVETESNDDWSAYATPDRFRFEILGDAVFEGSVSVRDVLDLADIIFSRRAPEERRAIAVEALDALLADDLVELEVFEGEAEASQLRRRARELLASGDREAGAPISIRPTSAGTALAENPPDEIRRLWRMP